MNKNPCLIIAKFIVSCNKVITPTLKLKNRLKKNNIIKVLYWTIFALIQNHDYSIQLMCLSIHYRCHHSFCS